MAYIKKADREAVAVAEKESTEPTWKDEAKEPEIIYVRATRVGFYDNKRFYPVDYNHPRAGEIFALRPVKGGRKQKDGKVVPVTISASAQFSKTWMERVDEQDALSDASKRSRMPKERAIITKTAADRSVI